MTRKTSIVLFGAVWLLLAPLVWGVSARTVNIREMVDISGTIFYGRCLSAVDSVNESRLSVRTYRFLVLDGLKNATDGQIVEFRQVASAGRGVTIPGLPQFRKGQELLLFLHGESKSGFTSPVGLQQGVFHAQKLENGETGFTNGYGNRNLDHQLTVQAQQDAGLQPTEVQAIRDDSPVPLSVLRDVVTKFERYNERTEGRRQQ